jgi:hypothetical protein
MKIIMRSLKFLLVFCVFIKSSVELGSKSKDTFLSKDASSNALRAIPDENSLSPSCVIEGEELCSTDGECGILKFNYMVVQFLFQIQISLSTFTMLMEVIQE